MSEGTSVQSLYVMACTCNLPSPLCPFPSLKADKAAKAQKLHALMLEACEKQGLSMDEVMSLASPVKSEGEPAVNDTAEKVPAADEEAADEECEAEEEAGQEEGGEEGYPKEVDDEVPEEETEEDGGEND